MQLNVDTVMLIIKIVCGTITGISTILGILSAVLGGKWRGLYKNVKAVNEKTLKIIELIEEAESEEMKAMHTYFKNVKPTAKNDYTGRYKGYNLITITAEG